MRKIIFAVAVIISMCCTVTFAEKHWATLYIEQLCEKQIIDNGRNYAPEDYITRKEFVAMVLKAVSAKPGETSRYFTDVDENDSYSGYITLAYELGIVSGYSDRTFRPDSTLKREEAAVILSRVFGFLPGYSLAGEYKDSDDVTPAAMSAIAYASRKKIINGYPDDTIRPHNEIKKSEAAVMLLKAMETEQNTPRFNIGYPRIAKSGIYGCIRLEISTNMPCAVKYKLVDANSSMMPAAVDITEPLISTLTGNRQYTVDIVADVGRVYDVYFVAVTPDGRYSKVEAVKNTTPLPYTEGDGTTQRPYGIYTPQHLDAVRYFDDSAFRLRQDVELSGEWKPIDDFHGSLDGNGYCIRGMKANVDDSYAGLFARISKGEIKNLSVDAEVSARYNAGVFAGENIAGRITGCVATGTVHASMNNAGGFCGESSGVIENSLSAIYFSEADAYAGGVVGQNYGVIRNVISAAHTVSADMYAGGISAVNAGGRIEKSLSACINVIDLIMNNCGRITINKKDGITSGNFAYDGMKTTSINATVDKDNNNGGNISWEDILDRNRACGILGWDNSKWIGGSRDEKYLIMRPKGTAEPKLVAGVCEYAPVRVTAAAELLAMSNNVNMHYLLADDLYFNDKTGWITVADGATAENGFGGSIDGNGHSIYGISGSEALIGTLSGVVKNLRISGMNINGGELTGAIAKINYGTITGCVVDDITIKTNADGAYAGGICGYNYGIVTDCEVLSADIKLTGRNVVSGGISAHNEGYIDYVAVKGNITGMHNYEQSEAVMGGICGYNSGAIYNAFSRCDIKSGASVLYAGGICAIHAEGDIYKCATAGNIISQKVPNIAVTAYVGGVCGLASNGTVMNVMSEQDIMVYASRGYVGGICGYNETAALQNSYAVNSVSHVDDAVVMNPPVSYTGGICGYNQDGNVGTSVALNKSVLSQSDSGRICGGCVDEENVYANFAIEELVIKRPGATAVDGATVSGSKVDTEFFVKPVSEGGLLGWSADVWHERGIMVNRLPVLYGVKYQDTFATK